MEDSPLSADLHFLLHKPEDVIYSELGLPRIIKIGETYTPLQQELFSKHFALKSIDAPFPDNIATGWFNFDRHGAPVSFAVVPDFQQMKVQELILNRIVERVKALERPDKGFLCGGMAWDEGELEGDFCTQKDGRNSQASLAVWNGEESSALYPGNTHEFATHSDARAAFFIELKKRMQSLFPQRNLVYMLEPYAIYKNWIEPIEMRPDRFDLMKDTLLYSEGEGAQLTAFADDPKIFASGLATRDRVGSTEPNEHGFEKIKEIVGKAGIHGSWFGWFGRFDKSGQGQTNNIQDIPRWHQLARAIPGWDNLCGVPLDRRSWDGDSYSSANSGMSDSVIYSRQPKTRKIFAVFLDGAGFVPLKPGETVAGIKRVDSFFCETEDGSEDVEILPDRIILKSSRRALASSK